MKFSFLCCCIMLLISCRSKIERWYKQIDDFEYQNKLVLNRFTDSLLKVRALDTTYILEFSYRYDKSIRFQYVDISGKTDGYIECEYQLSEAEKEMFIQSETSSMTYLKDYNCFLVRTFFFKSHDTTLLVVINKNTDAEKNYHPNLEKISQIGNYSYYKYDAWPYK
jgi:hypothetical protein